MTARIEIVRQNTAPFLRSGNGKRPDSSKDIGDHILGPELFYQSFVFVVKPRIPVYFSEIEGEATIVLGL